MPTVELLKATAFNDKLAELEAATAADREASALASAAALAAQAEAEGAAAATAIDRAITEAAAENAQASALTCATWAVLSGLTGSGAGQGAEVLDSDTGTHTDPVVGGTVPNAGRYSWSASPAGWRRIGATGLASKASVTVTGTTARVRDDGRWARCGVDRAEAGADRRALVRDVDGERIFDVPVRGTLNGVQTVADAARWSRCGYEAVSIGQDRRVLRNLAEDEAPADETAPVYLPWSDGADIFVDRQDTGQTVRVSQGPGPNTAPVMQDGLVHWTSDRPDAGTYLPRAPGGRYFSPPDQADEHPVMPLYWLACFGDSTTAGPDGWPSKLDDEGWNIPYLNMGRSANTALGIASRYWALEVSYDCPTIPADGVTEVVVTPSATNEGNPVETRNRDSGSAHGYVTTEPVADPSAAPFVVLRYDSGTEDFYIRRYAAGDAIPAGKLYFYNAPIQLVPGGGNPPPTDPVAPNFQDAILVLLIGRNSSEYPELVVDMAERIVAAHKPLSKRMILMPWIQGQDETRGTEGYEQRALALRLFRERWPENTLDIVPWLQAANDGSPADLAALAADVPPPSVMSDNVHPNNLGRFAIARGVVDFAEQKGWKS